MFFRVKENRDSGFCSVLKEKFKLSEPSSLELEELLYNPYTTQTQSGGGIQIKDDSPKISVIESEERYYENTAFGKIDFLLKNKTREKLLQK
ncbi:hypothetical protein PJW08_00995 [Tenacibaculum finnmarkense]|nr:hypothetical protein PJW08_00995 [Tenacibaculum finnmarkense]